LLVIGGFVGALELLCDGGVISPIVMISPSAIAASLWQILQPTSGFYPDMIATSVSVVAAIALAIVGGCAGGVMLHALPRLRRTLTPVLNSYYAVPTFMFYPVFIVLFGAGHRPIIAIAFLLAVVAMVTSTLAGIDRIPATYLRSARVMQLSRWQTAVWVQLPACTPALFTGIKLVVTYAFIGVIASEFILSGEGVGYAIANAYNNFENRPMYGLMLLIIVVVTLVNLLLHELDERLQARRTR
jgi:NitT/TauT family transport system permease protein